MDDQYLEAFIHEAHEEITKLNNSLLELESDPENVEAMDQIFRTAHTLKGNFGAMGFDDAADLAHALEDLLDKVRDGHLEVTPELMDLIFAGIDQIEEIVDEIEASGEPTIDTSENVSRLREFLDDHEETAGNGDESTSDIDGEIVDAVSPDDGQAGVVLVDVDLGDSDMPSVDATLILERVETTFTLLATHPDPDAIESGEFDGGFQVAVDAEEETAVESEFQGISQVETVETRSMGEMDQEPGKENLEDERTGDSEQSAENDPTSGGSGNAVEEVKSVRVEMDQLDDLHSQVEQLVTSRIKLRRAIEAESLDEAEDILDEVDKISGNVQDTVMDMRLIPLQKVVGKFPRMVRDLARELDKEVDFQLEGEDIELDRTILTEISDPLMHIIRNSLDHGIEPPEKRLEADKPREGTLILRATRERDRVVIEVEDDGRGLDSDQIAEKAIENGLFTEAEIEEMPDSELYDLVFHPGLSTAEEVTDTSGRGVGMDVVHKTVSKLDGSVSVDSTPEEGTIVTLRLPVTMAIGRVLFVQVGPEEYGIPIKHIDEITGVDEMTTLDGKAVVKHEEQIYPVVDLHERFEVPNDGAAADGGVSTDTGMLVRIRDSDRQIALRCDSVNSQEEVVIKPLEGLLSDTDGISGTAVLGDGNVVHILDVISV